MTPATYLKAMDQLLRKFSRAFLPAAKSIAARGSGEDARAAMTTHFLREVRTFRREAWALGEQFITEQAHAQGAPPPEIPPVKGYSEAIARKIVDGHFDAKPSDHDVVPKDVAYDLLTTGQRHVQAAYRNTVADIAKPGSGVRWARMLTGADNCGFCVMLASRGPVYEDASAAGHDGAAALMKLGANAPAKAVSANSWHDHCDCIAVPVFSREKWPGAEQVKRLYALYRSADAAYPDVDKLNSLRRYLAAMQRDGHEISPDLRAS